MDEASTELHVDVRPPEPMFAGHPRREDAEYGRSGTAAIFLYTEPLTGWCHVEARRLAERLEIPCMPEHGSRLNIAEIGLSVLGRQCLHRRVPDLATLQAELDAWESAHNDRRPPVRWQFTTADARIKLAKLYPSIPV